jgi:hypothetical protein
MYQVTVFNVSSNEGNGSSSSAQNALHQHKPYIKSRKEVWCFFKDGGVRGEGWGLKISSKTPDDYLS